jgi:hypothetical protein
VVERGTSGVAAGRLEDGADLTDPVGQLVSPTPSIHPASFPDLKPSLEVFTGRGHFTWAEPDVVTSSMG